MCEIFFVVKPYNTLTTDELRRFLKACLPSNLYNDDGWGAMWEKGFVKSPKTFQEEDIEYIVSRYRKSRFFAFHTRKATSPVNYENTHPFTIKQDNHLWRGIHNGVVHVPNYNAGVDSLELFYKIRDNPGANLGEQIKGALKKGVSGTYSVFIHSEKENKLYYFRNRPDFGFMLSEKPMPMIYGATKIDRLECLADVSYGVFPNQRLATPQSMKIYSIDLNTGQFEVVGSIEESYYYSIPKEVKKEEKKQKVIDYSKLAPRRGWGWKDSWG